MTLVSPFATAARTVYGRSTRLPVMGRAMIVHRSDIVSAGVSAILGGAAGMDAVTVVPSVYEAFRVARSNPPRVILYEYAAREGTESTSLLAGIAPRPALIALVSSGEALNPGECLAAGADAVIAIDNVSRETFHGAVRSAMSGTPSIVIGFPAGASADERTSGASAEITDLLTPRERQMLYLIGEGLTNREIAEVLVLSVKTVETHRANLSRKLNIRSRAGLMRLAMSGALAGVAVA